MINKEEPLITESVYHIYNKAIGKEKAFYSEENYLYFLKKFKEYIEPFVHTYCYCLMPNHFHFLIRIKSATEMELEKLPNLPKVRMNQSLNPTGLEDPSGFSSDEIIAKKLSMQFGNFFNAYAKAINKQEKRLGSLFIKPYKRVIVKDEKYLINLIKYIHLNPVEAKLCNKPEEWKFSSYRSSIEMKNNESMNSEILELFGDINNFIEMHN